MITVNYVCEEKDIITLNKALNKLNEAKLTKLDIIYEENVIKCNVQDREGANIFNTVLKINGQFCELIFKYHDEQFKVVEPRTLKESQFIISE